MEIKLYSKTDEVQLVALMRDEGSDWSCYYGETAIDKYRRALVNSHTYVAYEGDTLCGFEKLGYSREGSIFKVDKMEVYSEI